MHLFDPVTTGPGSDASAACVISPAPEGPAARAGFVRTVGAADHVGSGELGGKGRSLLALSRAGFPVPRWFALPIGVFQAHLVAWRLPRDLGVWLAGASPDDLATVRARVAGAPLLPSLRDAIGSHLGALGLWGAPVMVRSSATAEDGQESSLAGAFESVACDGTVQAVEAALRTCWASLFSERAADAARRRSAGTEHDPAMAVVVQALVCPTRAGVCFSRDPSGPHFFKTRRIEAVLGFGETLVQGEVTPASAVVDLDVSPRAVRVSPGSQEEGVFWNPAPSGGWNEPSGGALVRRRVDGALRDESPTAALDEDLVERISLLCNAVEVLFGGAVDIEWAEDAEGTLHLLQARPIVGLPPLATLEAWRAEKDVALWDNANVVESFSGVCLPLTFSHARACYERVYASFCRLAGVPEASISSRRDVLGNMIGHVRGRIYYNLLNWYRLVHTFPIAGENSSLMEEMMGVRQTLGDEERAAFDASLRDRPSASVARKAAILVSLASKLLRPGPLMARFEARIDALCEKELARGYETETAVALLARYESVLEAMLSEWSVPILNDARCMIWHGLFSRAVKAWVPEAADRLRLHSLVTPSGRAGKLLGAEGLASLGPVDALERLADDLRSGAIEGAAWLATMFPSAAREAFEAWRKGAHARDADETGPVAPIRLFERVARYLDAFGYRCPDEQKLESPDYLADPTPLFGLLRASALSPRASESPARPSYTGQTEGAMSGADVGTVLSALPWRRRIALAFLARRACEAIADRERLRLLRGKTFALPRRLFTALGARLRDVGLLDAGTDVFLLTVEEVRGLVRGHVGAGATQALVESRRAEYAGYAATPAPPERFLTRGPVAAYAACPATLAASRIAPPSKGTRAGAESGRDDSSCLEGLTACPGVITGRVLVARTFEEAAAVDGQILVAIRTDPGWVPLFSRCKGLVVERGSALSHSAVMARELGLPTLVGVHDATTRLETGDYVRLDASAGVLEILDAPPPEERVPS